MKKRITLLFLMTSFVVLIGCKSKLFINGKIVNPAGNKPVAGALITTEPVSNTVITDGNGEYEIEVIEPGIYTVSASKDGKRLGNVQINVTEAFTAAANIQVGIFISQNKSNKTTPLTVTYEGKTYNTVKIGTQIWLKENLNLGKRIESYQEPRNNYVIEKYCYGDNESNCDKYGALYSWDEAMQYIKKDGAKGICPPGWHIPTLEEFKTLKKQ